MASWKEMPLAAKLGIVVGVAVAISVALYFVVFKSTYDDNKARAAELKTKTADNERLSREYEPRLAELTRRVETLKQQVEIQKRIVPDEKEAAEFMHLMQQKARESGVEVRRYSASDANTKEFYTEVPFEMDLDGRYYAILDFFERVGKMERIINVSDIKMSGINAKKSVVKHRYTYAPGETVAATCTATAFFSHDAGAELESMAGATGNVGKVSAKPAGTAAKK